MKAPRKAHIDLEKDLASPADERCSGCWIEEQVCISLLQNSTETIRHFQGHRIEMYLLWFLLLLLLLPNL